LTDLDGIIHSLQLLLFLIRWQKTGVVAEALIPSFPTKTFPNHYTIATGLYPDHHGIVLNGFYADDLKMDYNKRDKSTVADSRFYSGEPIWTTAELQNIKAATLFWVGSEAECKGVRPTFWEKYNQNLPFDARIDSVYNWLSLPEAQRPHLVCGIIMNLMPLVTVLVLEVRAYSRN